MSYDKFRLVVSTLGVVAVFALLVLDDWISR